MGAFIGRRLLISVVVLFGISILLFTLLRLMPGDPAEMMLDPMSFTGNREEALEILRERLGLNQSLPVQYFAWISELLRGNFGYSYTDGRPVTEIIIGRAGATLRLMGVALVIALIIGITLGIIAALRRNTIADYGISLVSLLMISIPPFFVALIAIFVFGLTLRLLPTGGMNSPGGDGLLDSLRYLILPASILGLMFAGPYVRYARSSMIEVLGQDYMTTARSKGLTAGRVIVRHGLHNALIPLVTVIAVQIPVMFAGAVIIEQLFSWPGIGRMALDAILARNYPILLGFVMIVAVLVLLCNLIADVLYALIDPRIRL
jgi:peptide/nickel transport system permease protein